MSNFCGVSISVAVFQFCGKKIDQKNSRFNSGKEKPQISILKEIEAINKEILNCTG